MALTAISRTFSRFGSAKASGPRRGIATVFIAGLAWLMALCGAVAPTTAHAALETTRGAIFAVADPGAEKDRGQPSERRVLVFGCSGHCAMHVMSLPAEPAATLVATYATAEWPIGVVTGAVIHRPAAVERPPRA